MRRNWIGEDPEVGDECGGGGRDKSPRIGFGKIG